MATNFIGSIISLISKSDIRYRGVLHSIDPNEATVSLSGVRSMGTEGRKGGGEGEVEPGDQIYEFIVFRASDVKDLKIEQPSGAGASGAEDAKKGIAERDPAIVGVGRGEMPPHNMPPMQQHPHFGGYPGMYPHPHQLPPPPFSPYGPGFSPFNMPPQQQFNGTPPPNMFGAQNGVAPPPGSSISIHSKASSGSTQQLASASPAQQSGSRPSSVKPAGIIANSVPEQAIAQSSTVKAPTTSSTVQRPTSRPSANLPVSKTPVQVPITKVTPPTPATKTTTATASRSANGAATAKKPEEQVIGRKELSAVEKLVREVGAMNVSGTRPVNHAASTRQQPAQQQNARAPARHPLPPNPLLASGNGPAQRRGGGGRRGQGTRGPQNNQTPIIDVPDQDFDFEEANKKFNKEDVIHPNGTDAASPELKQGEEEVIIPPPEAYYDKTKSFFDNISSEAKEREDVVKSGRGGRLFDRRAERSKNLATFGVTGEGTGPGPMGGGGGGGYRGYGYGYGRGYRGRGRGRGGFRGRNN